ncbi:hypothetical protein [Umezawaea sp. NPDC059074]|uniref:hypothetical protein n=1 Tax=Umezawaea sp. NPDC059074 TaxID=3346716 RepID=UPI0036918FE6
MTEPDEEQAAPVPVAGMIISVRTRHDVVITDPEKFLATARQAYLDLNPETTEVEAFVANVHDAAYAIIERDGRLVADEPLHPPMRVPGERVLDRPDGLSPAGTISEIKVDVPCTLQDYGCSLPEDVFARPAKPFGA